MLNSADVFLRDDSGNTVLHHAAYHDFVLIANLLLKLGYRRYNILDDLPDKEGQSPLDTALSNDSLRCAKVFSSLSYEAEQGRAQEPASEEKAADTKERGRSFSLMGITRKRGSKLLAPARASAPANANAVEVEAEGLDQIPFSTYAKKLSDIDSKDSKRRPVKLAESGGLDDQVGPQAKRGPVLRNLVGKRDTKSESSEELAVELRRDRERSLTSPPAVPSVPAHRSQSMDESPQLQQPEETISAPTLSRSPLPPQKCNSLPPALSSETKIPKKSLTKKFFKSSAKADVSAGISGSAYKTEFEKRYDGGGVVVTLNPLMKEAQH